MPQLRGFPAPGSRADRELPKDERGKVNLAHLFAEHLKASGANIKADHENAGYMRASQNELDGAKVARLVAAAERKAHRGKFTPVPILLSKDNYIVDGHHHWAAAVGIGLKHETDINLPVLRVNMRILPLLQEARRFAAEWGMTQLDVSQLGT
jgi:hypothetical protein